jgi:hypothetical protein
MEHLTQHGASSIHSDWGCNGSVIREGSAVRASSKYQLPTDPKKGSRTSVIFQRFLQKALV